MIDLYLTCQTLSSLIENQIIRVRLPNPEMKSCYLKTICPNMLANTSLDLLSDMGPTDHRHYDR